jgi:hypothetical protein
MTCSLKEKLNIIFTALSLIRYWNKIHPSIRHFLVDYGLHQFTAPYIFYLSLEVYLHLQHNQSLLGPKLFVRNPMNMASYTLTHCL